MQALSAKSAEAPPEGRAALFIAHPGHELRLHAWLERARPVVFVLTDGAGSQQKSRLSFTSQVIRKTKATPGSLYGPLTDTAIYEAILAQRYNLFLELAGILGDALVHEQIAYLVSDPADGYNPSHDLCRLLADAATHKVRNATGFRIARYEYVPVEQANKRSSPEHHSGIELELSDAEFDRKLEAGRAYTPLQSEFDRLLERVGLQGFRIESLRPLHGEGLARNKHQPAPFYEQYGQSRVAAGTYQRVLRYKEHMIPLMNALQESTRAQRLLAPK